MFFTIFRGMLHVGRKLKFIEMQITESKWLKPTSELIVDFNTDID
jgi:hypothetical protein